ncbi:hypothetical protein PtA15_7A545 [Puccinia triticina]|uniref:Uncharacterized protein n=1 Tax=Puccinia triticina TaxID=208348 RepID=A0ABY7CRT0_9BASI|nr:uncharacterized protein PtA15_7A545 [Puccinia triticina]WAQ86816.1 hypothetical protein PtA15_7A545 [Puccinia triticina]
MSISPDPLLLPPSHSLGALLFLFTSDLQLQFIVLIINIYGKRTIRITSAMATNVLVLNHNCLINRQIFFLIRIKWKMKVKLDKMNMFWWI